MDIEFLFDKLGNITQLLMVVHNYDTANDLVEEAYLQAMSLRDKLEELIDYNEKV